MNLLRFDPSHGDETITFVPGADEQNRDAVQRIRAGVAEIQEGIELIIAVSPVTAQTAEIRFALGHLTDSTREPFRLGALSVPLHTPIPLRNVFTHVMSELQAYDRDFLDRF